MSEDHLLTPEEAAAFLQVKRSTIYAWVHQGFIPHVKLGGRLRFRRSALEDWLKEQEVNGRATRIPEIEIREMRKPRRSASFRRASGSSSSSSDGSATSF